jgi:hypothetical protein
LRTDEAPTEGIGTMADAPRVFLSYIHDSDEHAARVLALADALCDRGIDVVLDRYVHPAPAEGWPLWMERNLDAATSPAGWSNIRPDGRGKRPAPASRYPSEPISKSAPLCRTNPGSYTTCRSP